MSGNNALAGKAAIVTGGAGSIGSHCAKLLVRDGAAVLIMGRRKEALEALENLAAVTSHLRHLLLVRDLRKIAG